LQGSYACMQPRSNAINIFPLQKIVEPLDRRVKKRDIITTSSVWSGIVQARARPYRQVSADGSTARVSHGNFSHKMSVRCSRFEARH
jgi:hypothetical protein